MRVFHSCGQGVAWPSVAFVALTVRLRVLVVRAPLITGSERNPKTMLEHAWALSRALFAQMAKTFHFRRQTLGHHKGDLDAQPRFLEFSTEALPCANLNEVMMYPEGLAADRDTCREHRVVLTRGVNEAGVCRADSRRKVARGVKAVGDPRTDLSVGRGRGPCAGLPG